MNIDITKKALAELKTQLVKDPGKSVRLLFAGFGWGGPKLKLALEEPKENDIQVIVKGIPIFFNQDDQSKIRNSVIDVIRLYQQVVFVVRSAVSSYCWIKTESQLCVFLNFSYLLTNRN